MQISRLLVQFKDYRPQGVRSSGRTLKSQVDKQEKIIPALGVPGDDCSVQNIFLSR
jgi:hypothetical protein